MIAADTKCAACGCTYAEHCGVCGCLTDKGTRDECLCAKFVAVIYTCPHCGEMFGEKWRLDNHLLPAATCRTGARAASGRHAEAPSLAPPLRTHRDRYMKAAR